MKWCLLSLLLPGLAFGATPSDSGYAEIPKKREAFGSKNEPRSIRDEAVRPEEVFKNGVQEVALVATDTGYLPSRIIVRRNIPVRLFLTSASAKHLCFVLDEFSLRRGVPAQGVEEVRFLPTAAGQYKFYCPVQEIEGALVVRD
jgi:heme/copper-type cytochrome/quinol oxidase subunit 2